MNAATRDHLIIAALCLAESAWIFALLGVVGLALGAGGSPLGWIAILALLAAGALSARLISWAAAGGGGPMAPLGSVLQAALGLAAIYLAVGTQVGAGEGWWDPRWPALIVTGSDTAGSNVRATVGAVAALALWWRGSRTGSSEEPAASLGLSYRVGTVILTAAVVFDLIAETSLGTGGALFGFFAGALAGLGIARLSDATSGARGAATWLRAVGAVVALVLGIGFAFSLIRREFLQAVSAPFSQLLEWIGVVIFYAFIVPVAWIVNSVVRLFVSIFSGDGARDVIPLGESIGEQLLAEQQTSQAPAYLEALGWALAAIAIAGALYILYRSVRRRGRDRRRSPEGIRESVSEDADPALDAAALLLTLLPSALLRGRRGAYLKIPDGASGADRAVRGYYRLALYARSLGVLRPRSSTPAEHSAALAAATGEKLADAATDAFNEAFYGGGCPDEQALAALDAGLERLGAPELSAGDKVRPDAI